MLNSLLRWLVVTLFLPTVVTPAMPLDPDTFNDQFTILKPAWSGAGIAYNDSVPMGVSYSFTFWSNDDHMVLVPEEYQRQWLHVPSPETPTGTSITLNCQPTEIAYVFTYVSDNLLFNWELVHEGEATSYEEYWTQSYPDKPIEPAWVWFYFTPQGQQQVTGAHWSKPVPVLLSGCMERPEGSPKPL